MRDGIVAASWASYLAEVMPAEPAPNQVQECRRAFYAGARGLLSGILRALEPDHEPTPEDLRMMDAIEQELDDFAGEVLAGRA